MSNLNINEFGYFKRSFYDLIKDDHKLTEIYFPRQMGKTSLLIKFIYYKSLLNWDNKFCIVSHKQDTVDLIKRQIYDNNPLIFNSKNLIFTGINGFESSVRGCKLDYILFDNIDLYGGCSNINNTLRTLIPYFVENVGTKIIATYTDSLLALDLSIKNIDRKVIRANWWEVPRYFKGKYDPQGWRNREIKQTSPEYFVRNYGL